MCSWRPAAHMQSYRWLRCLLQNLAALPRHHPLGPHPNPYSCQATQNFQSSWPSSGSS
jgi:hypothetical protein